MKFRILFACLLLSHFITQAHKKRSSSLVWVSGIVTQTSDYCGGAMPSQDILDNLAKPTPLAQKTIFIKIGAKNRVQNPVYKKVVTDANGRFRVRLKAGTTYSFIEDWKAKPYKAPVDTKYIVWDQACMYERYLNADYVLRVNRSRNPQVEINYHQPCFYKPYCGTYSGPLPP